MTNRKKGLPKGRKNQPLKFTKLNDSNDTIDVDVNFHHKDNDIKTFRK
jgi:hypothetical protein